MITRLLYVTLVVMFSASLYAKEKSLALDNETEAVFSRLSDEDLCESIEDKYFSSPRNICLVWEIVRDNGASSCLEWGIKVNKQNYIDEFNRRKYPDNKCAILNAKQEFEKQLSDCRENPPDEIQRMNHCASLELEAQEDRLSKLYSDILVYIERIKNDVDKPTLLTALEKSQNDWLNYRKSQCQVYYKLYHRSPIASQVYNNCKSDLTKIRIMLLFDLYKKWAGRDY